ncbi:MAG: hypothetical protein PF487_09240, partial [Bacteroidales bacterium]|nr:hypothetical protein [Bacteroidales bacterium]
MKNIINFCLIIFISLIVSCNNENDSSTNSLIYNYPNLLDISGIPQSPKQYNNYCFSDKGSWFGFGLNTNNDTSVFGAFSGPFLMNIDNGRWLSMNLIKLKIYDNEREKNVLFNNKQISNNYFPGLLKQNAENNHFSVKMDLWFPKSNIAINRIKIQNITNKEKQITLN